MKLGAHSPGLAAYITVDHTTPGNQAAVGGWRVGIEIYHLKDLDMLRYLRRALLSTFCRLDELGLGAVGQRLEPDQAVTECRVAEPRSLTSGQHAARPLL